LDCGEHHRFAPFFNELTEIILLFSQFHLLKKLRSSQQSKAARAANIFHRKTLHFSPKLLSSLRLHRTERLSWLH
jgi:hypothetical protein